MEGRMIQRPASPGFREAAGPSATQTADSQQLHREPTKEAFSHMSFSLQVTGMIPMAHMGNPEVSTGNEETEVYGI